MNPRPWFSMSGQDLVADLSDGVCLASFSELENCSDQDQIADTACALNL